MSEGLSKTKKQKISHITPLLFPLSFYIFLIIYIYILHVLLFRRGTELFYTTLLHFCSPPAAIFFTLQENFFALPRQFSAPMGNYFPIPCG